VFLAEMILQSVSKETALKKYRSFLLSGDLDDQDEQRHHG
jgi:hypothetical protein